MNKLKIQNIRDENGKDWHTTSTKIVQVTDVTEQGYIKFNGSDNHYGMSMGTLGNDKITISQNSMKINPFSPNPSGTYYTSFKQSGKRKYWHFICAFEADHEYNLQTNIEVEFSQHSKYSQTTGYHNRGSRCVGKVNLQIISDSPSNKADSNRSDGRYEIHVVNNSLFTDNGTFSNHSFFLLSYGKFYYLVTSVGNSWEDLTSNYSSMFKINILDPFIRNVEVFNSNHILNNNYRPSDITKNKTDPKFLKPNVGFLGDSNFGIGNYLFLNISGKGNGNNSVMNLGQNIHSSI